MGIDVIRTYTGDGVSFCRDFSVADERCCYISDGGQGCDTIWFKTVPAARRAYARDKRVMRGSDLADCNKCANHHDPRSDSRKGLHKNICSRLKVTYAKQFEKQK